MPEVITPSSETLDDNEWAKFQEVLLSAIESINQHRVDEGLLLRKIFYNGSGIYLYNSKG